MSGKSSPSLSSRFKNRFSSVFSRNHRPSIPPHPPGNDSTRQGLATPVTPRLGPMYQGQGIFNGSHNFSMTGDNTFIDNSTTNTPSDNFMKELLQETIRGAEFDSSDRHPPPRCHPNTRLAIIKRCLDFVVQCNGQEKLRWIVGAAGVGKSAVMQIIAEQAPDGVIFASIFLSINGREDGSKTFTTIAYQFAVKCRPYRQFIQDALNLDPSLLRKSLSVQFNKFIVEPFVRQHLFDDSSRFLILIDGLDECRNHRTQRELLGLISDFCIKYPTSPIAWIVASRPEPHITAFFGRFEVAPAYSKEEMEINSEEACQDVQLYLRDELENVKVAYSNLKHKLQWPAEFEFTKIAAAAGGLFAYAATVLRYIDDPNHGDPVSQLNEVLEVIDAGPGYNIPGRDHPMAQLYALYARILSKIPQGVMANAKKLLLLNWDWFWGWRLGDFRLQCNGLGLTEDVAYSATRHLHSVVKVPGSDKADEEPLEILHKSFADYLCDFKRSGFFQNARHESGQLCAWMSSHIIEAMPDNHEGTTHDESFMCGRIGHLKGDRSTCSKIPLSWPCDERFQKTDDELRLELYRGSITWIVTMFEDRQYTSRSLSCFRALSTRFVTFDIGFPFYRLQDYVFDDFRDELIQLNILNHVPCRALDYAAICGRIELQFTSPIVGDLKLSDPWNPACESNHEKLEIEGLQQKQGWSTYFSRFQEAVVLSEDPEDDAEDLSRFNTIGGDNSHWEYLSRMSRHLECKYCLRRFARYFMNNPDQLATVFVYSTGLCYVELSFVDPDDGVSQWVYRFVYSGPPTRIDG